MLFALPLPVLSSVRVVTWFALFEARGYPAGITRTDARTLSSPEVAARVRAEAERLPRALARALATILAFSTEDGRRDVYNAAEAVAYPRRWPEAASPADLVAHLLAQASGDPDVALLLAAAVVAGVMRRRRATARAPVTATTAPPPRCRRFRRSPASSPRSPLPLPSRA